MSDKTKNPQKEPQSELFEPRNNDSQDYPTEIGGPGGTNTMTENNERGILDAVIFRTMATYRQAELGSSHDSYAQGVYREVDSRYTD